MNVAAVALAATRGFACPACGSAIGVPCRIDSTTLAAHRRGSNDGRLAHAKRIEQMTDAEVHDSQEEPDEF